MAEPIDYQVLLETLVTTAKSALIKHAGRTDAEGHALAFAYYDVLDAVKTQAEIMEVPLAEIGLEGFDLDALMKTKGQKAA